MHVPRSHFRVPRSDMLRLGIVGLPNVGKSTLFNALTSSRAAAAENYPFCTVEPNVGVVEVPDPRLEQLNALVKPKKKVPAGVEFVDIAGLVRGASQGEGLGNQFLSHIREVDAVVHVIRCFDDPDVVHVMGPVDPVRDHDVITGELALANLAVVERRLDKTRKNARAGDKGAPGALAGGVAGGGGGGSRPAPWDSSACSGRSRSCTRPTSASRIWPRAADPGSTSCAPRSRRTTKKPRSCRSRPSSRPSWASWRGTSGANTSRARG